MSSLLKEKKSTLAQDTQDTGFKENTSLSQSPLSQKLEAMKQNFAHNKSSNIYSDIYNNMPHATANSGFTHAENSPLSLPIQEAQHKAQHETDEHDTLNRQGLENRSPAQQLPFNIDKRAMQNTLALHASTQLFSQNDLQPHETKSLLNQVPAYGKKSSIAVYKKQLVETRTLIYYQQNLRLLSDKEKTDPEAKRRFVIKRVARELWTNFCVRGQESHMLTYLHESLRKAYNEDLKFYYKPGSIELVIMRPVKPEDLVKTEERGKKANTPLKGNALKSDKVLSAEQTQQTQQAQQAGQIAQTSQTTQAGQTKKPDLKARMKAQLMQEQESKEATKEQEIHKELNNTEQSSTEQSSTEQSNLEILNYVAVSRAEQVEMVNKAWQLAQEIVASHATE